MITIVAWLVFVPLTAFCLLLMFLHVQAFHERGRVFSGWKDFRTSFFYFAVWIGLGVYLFGVW